MKLQEVTKYNYKSQTILNESWQQLTESQRLYVGRWEKTVWPLMEQVTRLYEADLTANQINTIFANAETVAGKDGGNLTGLGKAGKLTGEVTGKMKTEIDKLLKAAQNSGPVKNFDQQFEKLKVQLKDKLKGNPMGTKILQGVEKWGTFAKDNPAKSAFIIGAMTSVLAFASGGIASGAAIGFFLKLANNTIKGDQLSTAMAKGVKGAAIGAIAGALGDAISGTAEDLFPPEVTNIFVNQDGAIDISQLDAMDATSLTDIDADAAKELIQARSAMEEMTTRLTGEEGEVLQQQLDQLNDKIVQLGDGENLKGSIDALQNEFGIEGRGVDVVVKGNNVDTGTDAEPLPGDDGDYGEPADDGAPDADKLSGDEVGTVKAEYSAEELNDKFNIDSSEFPRNAWLDENKDALMEIGMTEQEFEDLQTATQLERAVNQANFREGISVSADSEIDTFMGSEPKVIGGLEGEYEAGETFTSKIETKLPGTDKPWSATVDVEVQGVDANGDTVYAVKQLRVAPEIFNDKMFAAIDKLAETDPDNPLVKQFTDKVILSNQSASLETLKDTFAQDVAEKVMQGAAVVALSGALAQSEVKPAPAKESINYAEVYADLYEEYKQQKLDEIDIAGIAKKGAKAVGGALSKGMDKAGAAAQAGIGKAVKGVKDAGRQVGLKVTKEKLAKAHKAAGSPTDTASIVNILADNGLSDEQISAIGQESKVELPAPTSAKKAEPAKGAPAQDANKDGKDDNTGKPIDTKADAPAQPGGDAPAGTPGQPKAVQKGTKMKAKDGNEYEWKGALWVNTATNKPIGIIPSLQQGLPNPKLDPIIAAAKKDPEMAKAIKSQVSAKGVEPGTAGAQKAAQAGVKGTEPLDAQGVGA